MLRSLILLGLAAAVLAIPAQNCAKVAPEPVNAFLSQDAFDYEAAPQSAKRAAWTLASSEKPEALVTVVSRASEAGLEKLAESLDAQSLRAFQWVIVNDVSRDLSGFRATVVDCESCSKAAAMNAAAADVNTPYVVFVQEGDLLEDAFLERLMWVLETNQEFHYANSFSADATKKSLDTSTFYDNALETNMATTAMVRTSALKSLPAFPQVFNEVATAKSFFLALKDADMHGVTVPEFLRWGSNDVEDEDFDAAEAFPALAQRGHVNPLLQVCDDCKVPEITSTYKSTCDKSILVVVPQMSSADTASLEMVKGLTKSGYQVTVATTLASREGEALMPELLQFTQDVHVLPHFVRTEDFGHYMLHLVKTRGISAVVLSHSYAGYNFLPFLRASAPTVALVDMVHAKEAFWRPQAFFEDSEDAQGGGYARLSALFSQYLDASVYAKAEDMDWTAEEQDKIAQLESTSTTFYSPTKEYSAPERFTADLDAALVAAIAKAQTAVTTNEAVEAARNQVATIAASIQDNDGSMGSFMHTQNGNRYDLLFLENWDNERRTGNSTGNSTTPSPTAAATSGKTITQAITFTITGGVSAYTGNTKTLYERSYGAQLGLYTASSNTWTDGCSVDSSAVSGRRSNVVVTFTATASATAAANAEAQATALVSDSSALATTITNTKTTLGGDFASIATPTVQSVASPTTTTIVSGASQAATTSIVTVAMCMAAMLFRH